MTQPVKYMNESFEDLVAQLRKAFYLADDFSF